MEIARVVGREENIKISCILTKCRPEANRRLLNMKRLEQPNQRILTRCACKRATWWDRHLKEYTRRLSYYGSARWLGPGSFPVTSNSPGGGAMWKDRTFPYWAKGDKAPVTFPPPTPCFSLLLPLLIHSIGPRRSLPNHECSDRDIFRRPDHRFAGRLSPQSL